MAKKEIKNINPNKYINDVSKKNTSFGTEFYVIRTGKCNPSKCQSLCCRIGCFKVQGNYKDTFFNNDFTHKGEFGDYFANHKRCESLTLDGKCKLHGTKNQLNVCKHFPMVQTDGVYEIVKEFCGFKFKKVKNPNYKKGKNN